MALRACRKCKVERSEDQFPLFAGNPGHVCVHCKKPRKGSKASGVARKGVKATVAAAVAVDELTLAFPAGFGFDANTRGDVFQIDQWPAEAEGEAVSIVLSRAELATILNHFGAWSENRTDG